jgi:hypothetical protein
MQATDASESCTHMKEYTVPLYLFSVQVESYRLNNHIYMPTVIDAYILQFVGQERRVLLYVLLASCQLDKAVHQISCLDACVHVPVHEVPGAT